MPVRLYGKSNLEVSQVPSSFLLSFALGVSLTREVFSLESGRYKLGSQSLRGGITVNL